MGVSLLQAVAALMSTCTRRLQRAARRMGSVKGTSSSSSPARVVVPWRKAFSLPSSASSAAAKGNSSNKAEEGGVWRKEILMGERCQPLEFSGVIYYDADGRRLAHPPRSPMRSPLPASGKIAAANAAAW